MRFPDDVLSSLASFVVIVTSSSSSSSSSTSSSTTEELASLLLYFAAVMLVAGGGGGGRGGGSAAATGGNYSEAMMLMQQGPRRPTAASAADLFSRLGILNLPSARQLNRDALRSRLGTEFNGHWMSIDRPSALNRSEQRAEFDSELVNDLKDLSFSYEDERGETRTIPTAVRSVFERWLLQRASCPVLYTWEDMGELFWPRWIKHGHCDTDVPCSWPPGMHCAAAESHALRLLHWQCRRSSDPSKRRRVKRSATEVDADGGRQKRNQKLQCRWRKVPYPVTSECFCSC